MPKSLFKLDWVRKPLSLAKMQEIDSWDQHNVTEAFKSLSLSPQHPSEVIQEPGPQPENFPSGDQFFY